MKREFGSYASREVILAFLGETQLSDRFMGSSDELVWVKQTFFSSWRICNTAARKNTFDELKIAIKQSEQAAVLSGRNAGEVAHE